MGNVTRTDVIQVLMPSIAAGPGARVPGEVFRHTPSSPSRATATGRGRRSLQDDLQVLWEPKLGYQRPLVLRKPKVGKTTERRWWALCEMLEGDLDKQAGRWEGFSTHWDCGDP